MLRSRTWWVGALLVIGVPSLTLAGCRTCCPPVRCQPACVTPPGVPVAVPRAAVPRGRPILVSVAVFRVAGGPAIAATGSIQAGGRTYPILSKADADALRLRLSTERGVATLAMPTLLVTSGDVGTIFSGETIGPDVPGRTGREHLSFRGGDDWFRMRTGVLATASEDGTHVSMDFSFALREAPRLGQTPDLSAFRASEVSIRVEGLSVPSGDTVLLFSGSSLDAKDEQLWVLLRPSVVRPEDIGTAAPSASSSYAAPSAGPPTVSEPRVVEAWKTVRLTLSMKDVPLRRVLKAVAEQGSLSLFVSPDVADGPVSIDVADQDVPTVLTALGQGRFVWEVEDHGVIRIQGLPAK